MIYVWRASFGTWVIRPGVQRSKWALCWFTESNTADHAAHYDDPQLAVDAVFQQTTGVQQWDTAIGMAQRIDKLSAWEQVDTFP